VLSFQPDPTGGSGAPTERERTAPLVLGSRSFVGLLPGLLRGREGVHDVDDGERVDHLARLSFDAGSRPGHAADRMAREAVEAPVWPVGPGRPGAGRSSGGLCGALRGRGCGYRRWLTASCRMFGGRHDERGTSWVAVPRRCPFASELAYRSVASRLHRGRRVPLDARCDRIGTQQRDRLS